MDTRIQQMRLEQRRLERILDTAGFENIVIDIEYNVGEDDMLYGCYIYNPLVADKNDGWVEFRNENMFDEFVLEVIKEETANPVMSKAVE